VDCQNSYGKKISVGHYPQGWTQKLRGDCWGPIEPYKYSEEVDYDVQTVKFEIFKIGEQPPDFSKKTGFVAAPVDCQFDYRGI
jgi:hypothetical protein